MLNLIKHRGPDDRGVYEDKNVTLGNVRLSIIDLKNGHQPIFNEDKSIIVVFNGEIYNYKELQEQLKKKKHKFRTNCDTEVLVHMYEEYGINFVKKLDGMFAIALWDKKKQILYLARDSFGLKPLYYYLDIEKKRLFFASEMKAIVQSGILEPKVNELALPKFFFYRYIPGSETLFKNVLKVLPGEIIKYDGTFSVITFEPEITEQVKPSKNVILNFLSKSVKDRLVADVPVGTFLSGGIDSSSVSTLAKKNSQKKMESFSVQFGTNDGQINSEIAFAKKLSDSIGIKNNKIIIQDKEVIKNLPLIAWHYDEPMGDAATVPTFFISRFARKKVKVILSGEGGDELFAGYKKYQRMINNNLTQEELLSLYEKEISVFTRNELNTLFKKSYKKKNYFYQNDYNLLLADKNNLLKNLLRYDQKNMLAENYLMKADKMTMANSIEERVPFLERNLLNLTKSIPDNQKIKNGNEKYILKQAMKEIIPEEIINRQKQGYGTPTKDWFSGEIGKILLKRMILPGYGIIVEREHTLSKALKRYFNCKYIVKLIKEHREGIANHNTKLWAILAFDLWYTIYIDKKQIRPKYSYGEMIK